MLFRYTSNHLLRIYSAQRKHKNIERKIIRSCGVDIAENDGLANSICRRCKNFVNTMWKYRQMCQRSQLQKRENFSMKRCIKASPSKKVDKVTTSKNVGTPTKRHHYEIVQIKSYHSDQIHKHQVSAKIILT